MKIAIINNLYFPFNHGGAEQVVKNKIKDLQDSGHEVFLITTKPWLASKTKNNKLKIYYLNSLFYHLDRLPSIIRFFWHFSDFIAIRKYFKIKKILKTEQTDLVITHNLMGLSFLVPRAIKKLKIRHQHVLHDIQLLYPSGLLLLGKEKVIDRLPARIYQFLTRKLFASPEKIISPSEWLLKEHQQRNFFPDSKTEIKRFNLQRDKTKIENHGNKQENKRKIINRIKQKDTINWLFVGQIEEHKGILWLISAFKKIADPKLRLIIVGSGQELALAKKLAGTDSHFEFQGQLNSQEVKKIMTTSDYLIVPSLCYENSPTVIYEAQSLNLPVIATAIGGIPEIVGKKDYLFRAGNENDLKACWEEIKNQNLATFY